MSIDKRIQATAKNLEGKLQETFGKIRGNENQKIEGQMKQVEASLEHTQENIKERSKTIINRAYRIFDK